MHARPLIGYTGVTVVLLAALARLGRFSEPGGDAPAGLLPYLALGAFGWALGHFLRPEPARATLRRSLTLLGDALAGPCLWWMALLLGGGGKPVGAVAAGGAAFVGVAVLRVVRERAPDPLHPYFVAAWGGLLAVLARASLGLGPEALLLAIAAISVLVALGERWLSGPARAHAPLAAGFLLGAGITGTAARFGSPPSPALLALLLGSALALVAWAAVRGEALGPLGRWLGGAAYAAVTVALTATLRFLEAPLALYVGATAAWAALLAALAISLRRQRLDAFRDSAAWTAAVLGAALTASTAPAWWSSVGLWRVGWPAWWHEPAWSSVAVHGATAGGLAAVGVAAGALAVFRRRRPSIAYSVGGLAANAALRATLAGGAPLLVLLAVCVVGAAAGPVAPLAVAAVLLLVPPARARAFGGGLAGAGYAAVAAATGVAPAAHVPAALVLSAGAVLLFARGARLRASTPIVGALTALTAAVVSLSLARTPASLAMALVALVGFAAGRVLLDREAESTRSGAVLGWAVLASIWAVTLALVGPPGVVAGALALWLGVPLLLAGRTRASARAVYDPRLFVGEALETAALLVAHCAGAAALVLLWRAWGLPAGDAGPVLAGWAWAHLWLYRRLSARYPGRPATVATAIGSQTLALASLGLPLASSSLRIAIATLLMNAALFFFWSDDAGTRGRRRALAFAGHALNLLALATALVEASALAPLALLASALVFLWRAQRTHSAATHLAFLVTVTTASGLALRTGSQGPAVWVPSLTAVGLLAVGALSQAASGRTVAVRLSWAWGVMMGLVTVLGAALYRLPAARDLALLWAGFLLAAALWDGHGGGETVRPGEPEDEWLSLASHWVGHLAGAAALVAFCVAQGLGCGVAAAGLSAWAWLHWGVALSTDRRRTAGRALAQAARGCAALALGFAAFAWRETEPATLACALAGAFALLVGLTAADRRWRLVSALALTEAAWILGLGAGIATREYYLTTVAACLYLVLRLRRTVPDGRSLLAAGAAERLRAGRATLLPLAIFVLAVGYPFVALVRSGDGGHLAWLGAGTGLVLLGFWRAQQSRVFESAVCALFVGGALYAFATGRLDRATAALLLAAGLAVLANLLAGDAAFARRRAPAFSGPPRPSGVLRREA
jgi:hypothetical protein